RRVDASAGVSPQIAVAPDLPRASAERAGQPENLVAQADQSGGLRAGAGELNRATIRAIREKTKTFTREKLGLRPKPRDRQKAWPKAPEYGSFPDAAALTLIFCSRLRSQFEQKRRFPMMKEGKLTVKTPGAKILNDMPDFAAMGMKPHEVTSSMMQYNRKWI